MRLEMCRGKYSERVAMVTMRVAMVAMMNRCGWSMSPVQCCEEVVWSL